MLRFSISRSWKHLIQIHHNLAQFLELNQLDARGSCATLVQLNAEISTPRMNAAQMVLPLKDFNEIIKTATQDLAFHIFSSLDELTLHLQTQLNKAFNSYCKSQDREDLKLASFEIEFENALKIKVQNNDLEIQDQFRLNVVHDLPTEDAAIHGHDMKVGVSLAFKNWPTHATLTSLQKVSDELKTRAQKIVRELHKTKLNRHFSSPTGEQVSAYFVSILQKTKLGPYLKEVRVFETQKNRYSTTLGD